ncbi:MauE/DoxX family redox-associated membrane protein [Gemmatimonadota bacterium]
MISEKMHLQERAARVVALLLGLLFAAGVVAKVSDWETTREAMTVYTIISWLPPILPALGSLLLETFIAVTLISNTAWRRFGLPSAAGFLAITGVMLALETLSGGGGDCGCLPFLPRDISWLAAGQNAAAALFLFSLWRLLSLDDEDSPANGGTDDTTAAPMSPGDS